MAVFKTKRIIPQVGRINDSQSHTASAVCSKDSGGSTKLFMNQNKNILRVGEWNVRSLRRIGRLEDLKREMRRVNLDILGISEMKWPDDGDFWSGDYRIINAGSKTGHTGVGVIMNKKVGCRVKTYKQVSDRIIVVMIDTKPVTRTVISVYMPTSAHGDDEVEEVYEQIEEQIALIKGDENLIILGDWNTVVGEGKEGNVVGSHGLGARNDRGERLVEFCVNNKLIIANTFFKNPKRRIYTWKQPGDIHRYQIDYIMVKERFRNQVKDCKTLPGADIDSDHNLIVMKCELKLKNVTKKAKSKKLALERLKEVDVREKYQKATEELIGEISKTKITVDAQWNNIKGGLQQAAENIVGRMRNQERKPWITEEILELMEERRTLKCSNKEIDKTKYKILRNEINRKCKQAKEEWITKHCDEIEIELKKGKTDLAYRKVKKHFGKKTIKSSSLKDEQGKELINSKEKAQRWKVYLEQLYGSNNLPEQLEEQNKVLDDEKGDSILKEEFELALKELKKNKAPGIDDVPAELLQNASHKVKDHLFELICRIYEEGTMPDDFQKSVIVTLPKKKNADACENYRTISLLSHASKILTRIIYRRIEKIAEEMLSDDQFGFRNNRGTREAILALRTIIEERIKISKPIYMAFVDLEKAFDNVDWKKMFQILKKKRNKI